jgi:protein-L-isoaspartate(D-aspartate) O-methyltransferase
MAFADTYQHKGLRNKLVEVIRGKGITNDEVLKAIGKVPRHLFLDSGFTHLAYQDQALPIAAGQTISQPYTVAFQSELLEIKKFDKVLEVGTGSGYQAAILLEMGAKVFTIERQRELYLKTQHKLAEIGYKPQFFFGDGYKGLPTYAPFDKIIITAAANVIPETLIKQLNIGGKLIVPVGDSNQQKMKLLVRKSETEIETTDHGFFKFVPMLKGVEK